MSVAAIERRVVPGAEALELLSAGETAPPRGASILFVHGAYFGAWCWAEHWLGWFAAEGFDAHAVSLRGHGRSSGRERLHGFGLADYAEDLAAALDAIGRPAVLVGHSMGALVVQKYLERADAQSAARPVPAMALLCPVPAFGVLPASFTLAFTRPTLFAEIQDMAAGRRLSPEALREVLFAGDVDDDVLQRVVSRVQPESRRALVDMSGWGLPMPWAFAAAARPKPRALVLAAGRDAVIPALQVESTARMLGATCRVLPELGHALMLDGGWRGAAQALRDWIATED